MSKHQPQVSTRSSCPVFRESRGCFASFTATKLARDSMHQSQLCQPRGLRLHLRLYLQKLEWRFLRFDGYPQHAAHIHIEFKAARPKKGVSVRYKFWSRALQRNSEPQGFEGLWLSPIGAFQLCKCTMLQVLRRHMFYVKMTQAGHGFKFMSLLVMSLSAFSSKKVDFRTQPLCIVVLVRNSSSSWQQRFLGLHKVISHKAQQSRMTSGIGRHVRCRSGRTCDAAGLIETCSQRKNPYHVFHIIWIYIVWYSMVGECWWYPLD